MSQPDLAPAPLGVRLLIEPLLTTNQLARLLGVSPKTLRNWRYLGIGPPYQKVGGQVRYWAGAANRWLEQNSAS